MYDQPWGPSGSRIDLTEACPECREGKGSFRLIMSGKKGQKTFILMGPNLGPFRRRSQPFAVTILHMRTVRREVLYVIIGPQKEETWLVRCGHNAFAPKGMGQIGRHIDWKGQGRIQIINHPPRLADKQDHMIIPQDGIVSRSADSLVPKETGPIVAGDQRDQGLGPGKFRCLGQMPDVLFAVEGTIFWRGRYHEEVSLAGMTTGFPQRDNDGMLRTWLLIGRKLYEYILQNYCSIISFRFGRGFSGLMWPVLRSK